MIKLIKPTNGELVNLNQDIVKKYVDFMHQTKGYSFDSPLPNIDIRTLATSKSNVKNKPLKLVWSSDEEGLFNVLIDSDEEFKSPLIYKTKKKEIDVYNLLPDTTYFWKVTSSKGDSDTGTFSLDKGPLMMTVGTIKNVRDLGGTETCDNRKIKYGRVFRGYELIDKIYDTHVEITRGISWGSYHKRTLSKESKRLLTKQYKLKTELDLRMDMEAGGINYCQVSSDINYVRIPVNAYLNCMGIDVEGNDDEAYEQYRKVFLLFADKKNYPIYLHCWGGADRTGTVSFILKALAGCSYQDLIIDYELTSFSGAIKTRADVSSPFTTFYQMIEGFKKYYCKDGDYNIQKCMRNYMREFLKLDDSQIDSIISNLLD